MNRVTRATGDSNPNVSGGFMQARAAAVITICVLILMAACTDQVPTTPAESTAPQVPGLAPPVSGYVVQDLGMNLSPNSFALDINDAGNIVGWANGDAFAIENGQVIQLAEPPGSLGSMAWAISSNGHIAGTIFYTDSTRAAYWESATQPPLVSLFPGSLAFADGLGVNDAGLVAVTEFNFTSNTRRAVVWDAVAGTTVDIGTFGGPGAQANAVNDQGVVVGCAEGPPTGTHPFSWTAGGGMVNLLPGTRMSGCVDKVNKHGESGGWIEDPIVDAKAAIYDGPGSVVSFLEPNAQSPTVRSLNDHGVAVGYWTLSGVVTAFVRDRQIVDLPPLMPGADAQAWGINKHGVIVGNGTKPDGNATALMWCKRRCKP
jgi:probable HAF family extracellular repeat protein